MFSSTIESGGLSLPTIVTHAGGCINGIPYTNSLEALNYNYSRGCRVFEIDLELTSDNQIVLMHDWEQSVTALFEKKQHNFTFNELKKESTLNNITLLSIRDLENWLRKRSDVQLIGDVKTNILKIYQKIEEENPFVFKKLVPQIYYMWEYPFVKSFGYEQCILTLYKAGYS